MGLDNWITHQGLLLGETQSSPPRQLSVALHLELGLVKLPRALGHIDRCGHYVGLVYATALLWCAGAVCLSCLGDSVLQQELGFSVFKSLSTSSSSMFVEL